VESVLREAEELARRGYREVVLAGTHLSAYGRDLEGGITLSRLLLELEEVEGVERIRLSSLEPSALEEDFFQLLPRFRKLCPHFHLPLQSGSDRILGLMRRRYFTERFRNIIHRLREAFPLAGVSTDVMAGFPGEDEEDHRRTVEFCREMEFSHLHVFPFSPRRRTLAARLPHRVPEETKRRRVKELLELGAELSRSFRQKHLGRTVSVLVEGEREGWLEGLSAEGLRVFFRDGLAEGTEGKTVKPGEIVKVRVWGLREDGVEGVREN
jgi:threonylcarbamoyladenosine tRNA methylthiotransferase MtaB